MKLLPEKVKNQQQFNLAGIIPVAGQPLDFNFPWHDCLAPIGQNYLAIEKAVYDCAIAGCNSIWIVCPQQMQPLIRHRLGDWILDPVKYITGAKFGNFPRTYEIPIYYAPMLPKDVDRRDCLAWSIITGAQYSWFVGTKISRFTAPDRYFVSFPYGMFSAWWMQDERARIRSDVPFHAIYDNKSYKDGLWLPFTFGPEDFITCRNHFRKHEATGHDAEGNKLGPKERYTGRYFTHDFVFSKVNSENAVTCEVPWYYDISSWDGLKRWLGSDNKLVRPPKFLLSYNEWNPLGIDLEPEEEGDEVDV